MTTRRRFTSEFKARVALEALRGDKTVQEIAARHKVHPNQVSTWKRQAIDGLGEVFSNGADHERQDRETPAEAYSIKRPVDMMDKAGALPTSLQAQQQQKAFNMKEVLAA